MALWDRWQGFGRPMLADPGTQVLYGVPWLALVLPLPALFALFVVAHLWAAGFGLFLLARRGLPTPAALLAAVAWMASGPLLSLATMAHHFAAPAG